MMRRRGGDPVDALDLLDDVEQIDDEAFGSMRRAYEIIEDMDPRRLVSHAVGGIRPDACMPMNAVWPMWP